MFLSKLRFRAYIACAILHIPAYFLAQPTVDYRTSQSPVKNQGSRGTCTAFAIAAMLETLPGFPTDISEQHIYAWAKLKYYLYMPKPENYQQGGFLNYYRQLLEIQGVVPEQHFPYDPSSAVWDETNSDRENLENDIKVRFFDLFDLNKYSYKVKTGYLEAEEARDVSRIKKLLDSGHRAVAVSYLLNTSHWGEKTGAANDVISPWELVEIVHNGKTISDLERKLSLNDWIKMYHEDKVQIYFKRADRQINGGHAVTIVGYTPEGFLVKNSWSTAWGDDGYALITYDYHRLFALEVLYVTEHKAHGWGTSAVKEFNPYDYELKTLPHNYKEVFTDKQNNCISVSVVYTGKSSPHKIKDITYKVYDAADKLTETKQGVTMGVQDYAPYGYENYVGCMTAPFSPMVNKLEVEFTLHNGQKFSQTYKHLSAINRQHRAE
ncbi:MAG: C1 family peptidase [Chitinophagales bacterium]|nr:C1 family peptidase [Chitinophagales bacterium]MDW8418215.1 C1 family peptidase [Chitinophagales bacterium]